MAGEENLLPSWGRGRFYQLSLYPNKVIRRAYHQEAYLAVTLDGFMADRPIPRSYHRTQNALSVNA